MNSMRGFLQGIKKGMREFADNIAVLVNSILLTFVYLFAAGLTSLVARLAQKHFLDLNKKQSGRKKSYWKTLNLKKKPIDEYYRQF